MLKLSKKTMKRFNRDNLGHIYAVDEITFYECDKCQESFPLLEKGISLNGRIITECPYCKEKG
jgi:hypothetical protein